MSKKWGSVQLWLFADLLNNLRITYESPTNNLRLPAEKRCKGKENKGYMQGIEEKLIKIRVYTTKKGNMHYKNYNLFYYRKLTKIFLEQRKNRSNEVR